MWQNLEICTGKHDFNDAERLHAGYIEPKYSKIEGKRKCCFRQMTSQSNFLQSLRYCPRLRGNPCRGIARDQEVMYRTVRGLM